MDEITDFKLEIFIPADCLEALRAALAEVGAGQIGKYDHCCSISQVRGYWRPLEGANPFQGQVGAIETGEECKVEVNCRRELIPEALKAIRAVHPYEEPLINLVPLANSWFSQ